MWNTVPVFATTVSKDGQTFTNVGKVFGATAGIDLDAFGFGVADQFRFVRLTDDSNEGDQSGVTVGADNPPIRRS